MRKKYVQFVRFEEELGVTQFTPRFLRRYAETVLKEDSEELSLRAVSLLFDARNKNLSVIRRDQNGKYVCLCDEGTVIVEEAERWPKAVDFILTKERRCAL